MKKVLLVIFGLIATILSSMSMSHNNSKSVGSLDDLKGKEEEKGRRHTMLYDTPLNLDTREAEGLDQEIELLDKHQKQLDAQKHLVNFLLYSTPSLSPKVKKDLEQEGSDLYYHSIKSDTRRKEALTKRQQQEDEELENAVRKNLEFWAYRKMRRNDELDAIRKDLIPHGKDINYISSLDQLSD